LQTKHLGFICKPLKYTAVRLRVSSVIQLFQRCTQVSFWSLNPARVRHLFLKADLSPKVNYQVSQDMCNCRVSQNVVYRYSCRHTLSSHPK